MDLYVNVLECRAYPGVPARYNDINIAVIRQNTEGEYAMLEHEVSMIHHQFAKWTAYINRIIFFQSVPGVVESMKIITDENSERVARYAFEYGLFKNQFVTFPFLMHTIFAL